MKSDTQNAIQKNRNLLIIMFSYAAILIFIPIFITIGLTIFFKRINSISMPQTTTELIYPVTYENIQSADSMESNQSMNRNVDNNACIHLFRESINHSVINLFTS